MWPYAFQDIHTKSFREVKSFVETLSEQFIWLNEAKDEVLNLIKKHNNYKVLGQTPSIKSKYSKFRNDRPVIDNSSYLPGKRTITKKNKARTALQFLGEQDEILNIDGFRTLRNSVENISYKNNNGDATQTPEVVARVNSQESSISTRMRTKIQQTVELKETGLKKTGKRLKQEKFNLNGKNLKKRPPLQESSIDNVNNENNNKNNNNSNNDSTSLIMEGNIKDSILSAEPLFMLSSTRTTGLNKENIECSVIGGRTLRARKGRNQKATMLESTIKNFTSTDIVNNKMSITNFSPIVCNGTLPHRVSTDLSVSQASILSKDESQLSKSIVSSVLENTTTISNTTVTTQNESSAGTNRYKGRKKRGIGARSKAKTAVKFKNITNKTIIMDDEDVVNQTLALANTYEPQKEPVVKNMPKKGISDNDSAIGKTHLTIDIGSDGDNNNLAETNSTLETVAKFTRPRPARHFKKGNDADIRVAAPRVPEPFVKDFTLTPYKSPFPILHTLKELSITLTPLTVVKKDIKQAPKHAEPSPLIIAKIFDKPDYKTPKTAQIVEKQTSVVALLDDIETIYSNILEKTRLHPIDDKTDKVDGGEINSHKRTSLPKSNLNQEDAINSHKDNSVINSNKNKASNFGDRPNVNFHTNLEGSLNLAPFSKFATLANQREMGLNLVIEGNTDDKTYNDHVKTSPKIIDKKPAKPTHANKPSVKLAQSITNISSFQPPHTNNTMTKYNNSNNNNNTSNNMGSIYGANSSLYFNLSSSNNISVTEKYKELTKLNSYIMLPGKNNVAHTKPVIAPYPAITTTILNKLTTHAPSLTLPAANSQNKSLAQPLLQKTSASQPILVTARYLTPHASNKPKIFVHGAAPKLTHAEPTNKKVALIAAKFESKSKNLNFPKAAPLKRSISHVNLATGNTSNAGSLIMSHTPGGPTKFNKSIKTPLVNVCKPINGSHLQAKGGEDSLHNAQPLLTNSAIGSKLKAAEINRARLLKDKQLHAKMLREHHIKAKNNAVRISNQPILKATPVIPNKSRVFPNKKLSTAARISILKPNNRTKKGVNAYAMANLQKQHKLSGKLLKPGLLGPKKSKKRPKIIIPTNNHDNNNNISDQQVVKIPPGPKPIRVFKKTPTTPNSCLVQNQRNTSVDHENYNDNHTHQNTIDIVDSIIVLDNNKKSDIKERLLSDAENTSMGHEHEIQRIGHGAEPILNDNQDIDISPSRMINNLNMRPAYVTRGKRTSTPKRESWRDVKDLDRPIVQLNISAKRSSNTNTNKKSIVTVTPPISLQTTVPTKKMTPFIHGHGNGESKFTPPLQTGLNMPTTTVKKNPIYENFNHMTNIRPKLSDSLNTDNNNNKMKTIITKPSPIYGVNTNVHPHLPLVTHSNMPPSTTLNISTAKPKLSPQEILSLYDYNPSKTKPVTQNTHNTIKNIASSNPNIQSINSSAPAPASTASADSNRFSNYDISDFDSDASSDNETEPKKERPYWAYGPSLKEASMRQEFTHNAIKDMKKTFAPVIRTVPRLREIFIPKRKNCTKESNQNGGCKKVARMGNAIANNSDILNSNLNASYLTEDEDDNLNSNNNALTANSRSYLNDTSVRGSSVFWDTTYLE